MFPTKNCYVVSLGAVRPQPESGADIEIVHQGTLIAAASIKEAADEARSLVLEKWKKEEGWIAHQAHIKPASDEDYTVPYRNQSPRPSHNHVRRRES